MAYISLQYFMQKQLDATIGAGGNQSCYNISNTLSSGRWRGLVCRLASYPVLFLDSPPERGEEKKEPGTH